MKRRYASFQVWYPVNDVFGINSILKILLTLVNVNTLTQAQYLYVIIFCQVKLSKPLSIFFYCHSDFKIDVSQDNCSRACFSLLCPALLTAAALFTSDLKRHIKQNRVFNPNLIHGSLDILSWGQAGRAAGAYSSVLYSIFLLKKKSSLQYIGHCALSSLSIYLYLSLSIWISLFTSPHSACC